MESFAALSDPIRRRIIELIGEEERKAGDLARRIGSEYGITQPAVSRHLRVLREAGLASVRSEGTQRLYRLNPGPLVELDDWLKKHAAFWQVSLEALDTEVKRGRRARRQRREKE